MARPPLALLWYRDSETKKMKWKSIQTANAARGVPADEVVFVREPTTEERLTVMETLSHSAWRHGSTKKSKFLGVSIVKLDDLVGTHEDWLP